MNVPAGSIVARRMTSRSSATGQAQPRATSIAWTRDVAPSSDPTRTMPPNGPAANASAARSMDRAVRSPSSPRTSRWPVSAPSPSRIGSSRNQGVPRRSAGAVTARSRAAAIRSVGGPAQALGTHGRTPAPSVVDAMNPTAPRATTPGPIQRSHRDSTMRLTSSGGNNSWREEGETQMLAGAPYRGLSGSERRTRPCGRVDGRGEGGASTERAHLKVRERGAQPPTRASAAQRPPWYRATSNAVWSRSR